LPGCYKKVRCKECGWTGSRSTINIDSKTPIPGTTNKFNKCAYGNCPKCDSSEIYFVSYIYEIDPETGKHVYDPDKEVRTRNTQCYSCGKRGRRSIKSVDRSPQYKCYDRIDKKFCGYTKSKGKCKNCGKDTVHFNCYVR
jgi:hypothetical protein